MPLWFQFNLKKKKCKLNSYLRKNSEMPFFLNGIKSANIQYTCYFIMTNKLRIFGIIIESASTNIISLGNEHALLSSATLDRVLVTPLKTLLKPLPIKS